MSLDERSILAILGSCLETYDLPEFDYARSYLATTRLSLHVFIPNLGAL
jgi:hypothetical protein